MDDIAASVGIAGPALYRTSPTSMTCSWRPSARRSRPSNSPPRRCSPIRRTARRDRISSAAMVTLVIDVHPVLLWKRERSHLNAPTNSGRSDFACAGSTSRPTQIIRGRRPELSEEDAQCQLASGIHLLEHERIPQCHGPAGLVRELARKWLAPRCPSIVVRAAKPHSASAPTARSTPAGRRERVRRTAPRQAVLPARLQSSSQRRGNAEASQTAIATVYQLVSNKADLLHAVLARGSEGTTFMTTHRLAFAADDESSAGHDSRDLQLELACGPHARSCSESSPTTRRPRGRRPDSASAAKPARVPRELDPRARRRLGQSRHTNQARARVHTAVAVIAETVLIPGMRKRENLHGGAPAHRHRHLRKSDHERTWITRHVKATCCSMGINRPAKRNAFNLAYVDALRGLPPSRRPTTRSAAASGSPTATTSTAAFSAQVGPAIADDTATPTGPDRRDPRRDGAGRPRWSPPSRAWNGRSGLSSYSPLTFASRRPTPASPRWRSTAASTPSGAPPSIPPSARRRLGQRDALAPHRRHVLRRQRGVPNRSRPRRSLNPAAKSSARLLGRGDRIQGRRRWASRQRSRPPTVPASRAKKPPAIQFLEPEAVKLLGTEDGREGMLSFVERREARFTGR